jgi:AraC-like DNA-binding protein
MRRLHVLSECSSLKLAPAGHTQMQETCVRADSIEHWCEKVDMPYHTLRETFRRVEGISLVECWQRCRLQKAKALLANRGKYIFEVAYELGFSSDGNFANWFKETRGDDNQKIFRASSGCASIIYSKPGQNL